MDLVHAAESNNEHPQKILNALAFPDTWAGITSASYSSNFYACSRVIGHEGYLPRPFPIGDFRWGLAATSGAFNRWHIDSDGFGTFVEPISGAKWWFMARPIDSLAPDMFNSTGFLMNEDWDLDMAGNGVFAVEAILLEPGSMLYV